jgi:hypothetical protein
MRPCLAFFPDRGHMAGNALQANAFHAICLFRGEKKQAQKKCASLAVRLWIESDEQRHPFFFGGGAERRKRSRIKAKICVTPSAGTWLPFYGRKLVCLWMHLKKTRGAEKTENQNRCASHLSYFLMCDVKYSLVLLVFYAPSGKKKQKKQVFLVVCGKMFTFMP